MLTAKQSFRILHGHNRQTLEVACSQCLAQWFYVDATDATGENAVKCTCGSGRAGYADDGGDTVCVVCVARGGDGIGHGNVCDGKGADHA